MAIAFRQAGQAERRRPAPGTGRAADLARRRARRGPAAPAEARACIGLAAAARAARADGITPDALRPATIDESATKGEVPRHIVSRLARAKAEAAKKLIRAEKDYEKAFVLAADTVVAVGRRMLGKAELEHEARRRARACCAAAPIACTPPICLSRPTAACASGWSRPGVRFRNLSNDEIGNYLASGEWKGKAGGYAIQGIAGSFVVKLVGSYTNVVGLPLDRSGEPAPGRGLSGERFWLSKAEVETELSASARRSRQRLRRRERRAKRPKCPICGKPASARHFRPFCSKHCADIDLGALARRPLCHAGEAAQSRRRRGERED